jgi:hypothetical protein
VLGIDSLPLWKYQDDPAVGYGAGSLPYIAAGAHNAPAQPFPASLPNENLSSHA